MQHKQRQWSLESKELIESEVLLSPSAELNFIWDINTIYKVTPDLNVQCRSFWFIFLGSYLDRPE